MKNLSAFLISWIMCFSASAEVTTVFDFAAGPESGIGMPDGVSWPDDGFVETAKEATFRIEDISIRTTYTGSSSKIYKDADGEVWYYRLYKGCKVSFMCTDDNIIKVSMTFIQTATRLHRQSVLLPEEALFLLAMIANLWYGLGIIQLSH